ncbi:MAG TPA: ParA family protein [Gemmatimonadales bacterium]|nr:ParA family protein [Gemmatimonadales bacterium]
MPMDTRVTSRGKRIPVVAFFGAKGGVGKTTISRQFAELITLAPSAPNVLLVDADVYTPGMTTLITGEIPISCKTVHDYIASRNTSDVEAMDVTAAVRGRKRDSGHLFFIPASVPEARSRYDEAAKIGPEAMLRVLHEVVSSAVNQYQCDCVVIDCTAIIEAYTAAASLLADRAFIIGHNEPISFQTLKTYPNQIRDRYPEFTTAKMRVIINRVHVYEALEQRKLTEDVFAAIPNVVELIEATELNDWKSMRTMVFQNHIVEILRKTFGVDHPELVPDPSSSLPPQWEQLLERAPQLDKAPKIRRLGRFQLLLPVGLLVLVVGVLLFLGGSSDRHRAERAGQVAALVQSLEGALAAAEARDPQTAGPARDALTKARALDPGDEESWNLVVEASRVAGVTEIPALVRGDSSRETLGLGVTLGGVVLTGIGMACWRRRRTYLGAIHGIKKGGAEWMLAEMKKRTAQKTFDQLLKAVN